MPFVDLIAKDDYTSIWYSTNSPCRNVGGFDPAKPTIVMMHPLHVDSTWLYPQLDDPRLGSKYNVVVFDTRVTGPSTQRFSGKYDLNVAAADIAHAFYHLRLPAAHIFASEVWTLVALRLAAIFPELCLSLTLCNVPSQVELKGTIDVFEEMTRLWCFAADLESFEHACGLLVTSHAAPHAHPDFADELVAFYQMHWPPFQASRLIAIAQVIINRMPMSSNALRNVQCPVLICQAENNPLYPFNHADRLCEDLLNVPGGATVYGIKSMTGLITVFSASIINKVFSAFLSRQPVTRSDPVYPTESLAEMMMSGLQRLAEFEHNPLIAFRDPASPLSFSLVTEEVYKDQEETFRAFEKGQKYAFSPLGNNGRPLRKFSERKDETLLIESDGFSYAGRVTDFNGNNILKPPPRAEKPPMFELPSVKPMTPTDMAHSRARFVKMGQDFLELQLKQKPTAR